MHRLKNNGGFTLIELLIVVLIIGISLSWGVFKTFNVVYNYRLAHTAEHFAEILKLCRQQAIITSTVLGLTINSVDEKSKKTQLNTFIVDPFSGTGKWQPSSKKLANFQFPTFLTISSVNPSMLVFYPNGQMNSFNFQLSSKQTNKIYSIQGHHTGKIEVFSNK